MKEGQGSGLDPPGGGGPLDPATLSRGFPSFSCLAGNDNTVKLVDGGRASHAASWRAVRTSRGVKQRNGRMCNQAADRAGAAGTGSGKGLTMWYSVLRGVVFAALCLFVVGTSWAQQPSSAQQNAIRQNCRSDYQSLCSSVPTGGQASLQCLQQHAAELSPACGQAVGAIGGASPSPGTPAPAPPQAARPQAAPPANPRAEMALMRNECGLDYRRFCRGVRLGGGRAVACLADHQESLSDGCRNALMSMRAGQ